MATNPHLLNLFQGLASRMGGPPGPPGAPGPGGLPGADGALAGVRETARTPVGSEQEDLDKLKGQIQALVPRLLSRGIANEAGDLAKCIRVIDKVAQKLRELPQAPVMPPPPNLPMMGGPAMMPPQEPASMGMMG
jgi:hypothetical protein